MKMLKDGEEADQEVTREDQANINAFSQLNAAYEEIEEIYNEKLKEIEYLEDLDSDLELVDDDDVDVTPVRYRIGDIFTPLQPSEAKERIKVEKEDASKSINNLKNNMEQMGEQMNKLKKVLYGKFGQSINLERG